MKQPLTPSLLPQGAVLVTCSSHEGRCLGLLERMTPWKPAAAVLFHYDDDNPKREQNHGVMESRLRANSVEPAVLPFTEASAVKSLRDNMQCLRVLFDND